MNQSNDPRDEEDDGVPEDADDPLARTARGLRQALTIIRDGEAKVRTAYNDTLALRNGGASAGTNSETAGVRKQRVRRGAIVGMIRRFLAEQKGDPVTAKDVEIWLGMRGYTTAAAKFYQTVYATLKAMPDVCVVECLEEGRKRFILRSCLPLMPKSYTVLNLPRRTSLKDRRTGRRRNPGGSPQAPDDTDDTT